MLQNATICYVFTIVYGCFPEQISWMMMLPFR